MCSGVSSPSESQNLHLGEDSHFPHSMAKFAFPEPDRIRKDKLQRSLQMAVQALFLPERSGFFLVQVFKSNDVVSAGCSFAPGDSAKFIADKA